MGHNLCLDIFGPPSDEESIAGLSAHGEAPVAPYELRVERRRADRERAFSDRRVSCSSAGSLCAISSRHSGNADEHRRPPIARSAGREHVTLGPPFLERGVDAVSARPRTRSKVFESTFGADDYLTPAAEFDWPMAPRLDGAQRRPAVVYRCGAFERLHRASYGSQSQPRLLRRVFSRAGRVVRLRMETGGFSLDGNLGREPQPAAAAVEWADDSTRGMEFGVSPMPETRQAMIERAHLFGAPCFRTIAAGGTVSVEYCAVVRHADANTRIARLAGVIGRYSVIDTEGALA